MDVDADEDVSDDAGDDAYASDFSRGEILESGRGWRIWKAPAIPMSRFISSAVIARRVYNRAMGNVPYSRHLRGESADIFADEHPEDGIMDDLKRDGNIERSDVRGSCARWGAH